MSPEQATGRQRTSTPAATSTALGAVAYFLLTGQPPFDGDKAIKIILAHAQRAVVPPSRAAVRDARKTSNKSCCDALAKKPADRFRDVSWLRHGPSGESGGGPLEPWRSRQLVARAMAATIAMPKPCAAELEQ